MAENLNSSFEKQPLILTKYQKFWGLLGIGMGQLIFSLDVHIVNIALPTLKQIFHTNLTILEWLPVSYLLAIATFTLGVARLGDMYSKKGLYLIGLTAFTISSLLCGTAPTIHILIGFRIFQGVSATFISAVAFALVTEVFPEEERGRSLGITGAIFALGTTLGPALGGLLISLGNWRVIFLINVPIGIFAITSVALAIPFLPRHEIKQGFDFVGTLLIAFTLICFVLGMTQIQRHDFNSSSFLIMLVLASVGLSSFLMAELYLPDPILDLQIFRNLSFSLNLLLNVMVYTVTGGTIFILPFFLELVKHYTSVQAGALIALLGIVSALFAPIGGFLGDRFGERVISLIGLFLLISGYLAIGTFNTQLSILGYILRILPYSIALSLFITTNNSAVMGLAPRDCLGLASGLLALSRILGHTIGLPLISLLFSMLSRRKMQVWPETDVLNLPAEALVFGMQQSFHIIVLILVVAIILATILWYTSISQKECDG